MCKADPIPAEVIARIVTDQDAIHLITKLVNLIDNLESTIINLNGVCRDLKDILSKAIIESYNDKIHA